MSLTKDNIWKLLAPLVVVDVIFFIPAPGGMPPQAWHYFAVFVAMIVGMILESIPATAISFIVVTTCIIGSNYLLFDTEELADPVFNAQRQTLRWGLAGFSSTTVWLVFGVSALALGYEVSGLGRRIALSLVKFMGKRTLTLGHAIAVINILLAPSTLSNTARTGSMVFPVTKNLPPLSKSFPNDPPACRIGGHLMRMMVISTSLSSSTFVTGAIPNVLGLEFVSRIASTQISWLQWFLCFLPVGAILPITAPQLSYMLCKPKITHSEGVAIWASDELRTTGALTHREQTLIGPVLLSLDLWVFSSEVINATAVGLLVASLMLTLYVVPWKDITRYNSVWNTLANLATLVMMANGLTCSGFTDWLTGTMGTHLKGFPLDATVIVLVLMFYFAHYLLASLPAHTAIMLPATLVVGKGIPGMPMEQLCTLLVLSIGVVGCLTSYVTSSGVIVYGCGYVKSEGYWRLGAVFGVIYIFMLLLVGWPTLTIRG